MKRLLKERQHPAGIDELELWPDAIWRLAALLKAGTNPAFALAKIGDEATANREALESEPAGFLTGLAERLNREKTGFLEAACDLETLLECCAQAATAGTPVSVACQGARLQLKRPVSRQRARSLAACWQVSERTGAPLSDVLERFARYLETDIDMGQLREAAMGGPKATGRILSWLPLLGLGLGILMGTDPLGVLFGSMLGAIICCLGLGLALAGSRWTSHLIARAETGGL
ncbi:MAG: hypothetical protein Q3965_03475 [Rothia sp. (in: high G+C Gram-positive bacteria)]|nr:hypothetical protein [Rothia sp. (in: high G+C Gram-positive bacteria)]